jgi:transposase
MWVAAQVKDPVLQHAPTCKSMACFGAVSLATGKFACSLCQVFDAQTFEQFLRLLLRRRRKGKRIMVILDNARYHHAKLLKPFLHKYRKVLTLVFLPPYSPQLAPIERVWKLMRRMATHHRYFQTLEAVLDAVQVCFARWLKPNAVLKRLCGVA